MAELEYLNGDRLGQRVLLTGPRAIMGRHPDCDVILDQGAISRQHAQITQVDGEFFVEDLRSRNGTFVNDELVQGSQKLKNGDEIKICDMVLCFHRAPTIANAPAQSLDDTLGGAFLLDDSDRTGQSTVMSKLEVSSGRDGMRLSVNPETKLRAMIEIMRNLSQSLALEQILPKILDSLFNIFMQADRGFVVFATPEGRLVPKAFKHRRAEDEETARLSRTIVNEAIKTKQAILSADAATDARFEMSQSIADFRIRSMMCAPLVTAEGEVLGVIQIDTLDQRARFTNDDLDVLAGVASQAAFAIDNARLHERQLRQQSVQRDLELAHKVQQGLLPSAPPPVAGYQFFDFYEPANQVGGDFYDYIKLPNDRVAIVLADVSGKGVAAALVMAKLSAEVRYCLLSEPTAAKAVEQINNTFCAAGWEDRFVTFVLALVDVPENRVTIVNAGHMPPFLRNGAGKVVEVAPDISGLPLGITDSMEYESSELELAPGEIMTLFTDGISEALNPANELYTLERLSSKLMEANNGVASVGKLVLDDVRRHASGRAQSDDMCMVVFGRQG